MAKSVYIADICKEIFAGGDVPKDALSYEKTEEYNVPIFSNGEKNCGLYGYTNNARVKEPSITVSARGTIGYTAIRTEPFVPVVRLITLTPKSEVIDLDYLFYATQNYKFEGSGTSIPQLTVPMLKKYKFPLPEMSHQKAIAVKFEKLDQLISLRKQQLAKLDELVKARFVEMFGDVLLNSMQWPEKTLENMANIVSGITKGRKTAEADLQEVPYMAVSNVKDGYIDWTTVKTILATRQEIEQYRLMPDDILMTEGGDPDKVGRGAIIKVPLKNSIHQNHIFRVRLDESELLPSFFAEYLQHQKAKRYFLGCAKQTTGIASINMRQLKSLPVLLPPLSLQNQFATFMERVDQQKQTVQQSLEKLELMKKALMQEYFG